MQSLKSKKCSDSLTIMTELLLPNDTNHLNNLMGGRMMHWMDVTGAIAAMRHSNEIVVTASVDNISFRHPIPLGSVIILEAFVTRTFNTSMEVYIKVTSENSITNDKMVTNTAFITYVAVNDKGKPISVAEAIAETDFEKELFEGALKRRQIRLIFAKRMKPEDALELKSFFNSF